MTVILAASTDALPPKDRLPFLIEQFGRQVRKVDWTPAPGLDPLSVRGQCRFITTPQAQLAQVAWSSGTVVRANNAAEFETGETLLIYRERQHTTWFEVEDGTRYETMPGSLTLYPSDIPFCRGGIAPDRNYDFLVATLPMHALARFDRPGHLRTITHLDPRDAFNALLSSYFSDWCRSLPDLVGEQAEVATRTLINLLAVAGGAFDRRETEAQYALAAARVRAAERFIAANIHRPELSPQLIAAHLRVSVRQLHLDFEPTGRSVARRILAARIDLACRLLLDRPEMSITEVAFSAGFEGLSTFYRVFKSATGTTASDYRRDPTSRSWRAGD